MNSLVENQINKFLSGRGIIERKILSKAFNIKCEKVILDTNQTLIFKYYIKKNQEFNSIISETKSLNFFSKKFPHLFPSIIFSSNNLLIMDYIINNNIKKNDYQELLLKEIIKIHSISNKKFGFDFDSQIGGLRQPNKFNTNWVVFYRDNRLNMIFEILNKTNPMPNTINKKLEKLIKNLHNFIPHNPKISLLHGDLWDGNILFNDGKLVGLIDPGGYFGHNELEIAYLTWFKFIDQKFINEYSNIINLDSSYYEYEAIYQLYFSLLNVHLWSRDYIKDVEDLLYSIKL